MSPCAHHGRSSRCASPRFSCDISEYISSDHEERIPLFVNAGEVDPDLPFAPLIRYVFVCSVYNLLQSTEPSMRKTNLYNSKERRLLPLSSGSDPSCTIVESSNTPQCAGDSDPPTASTAIPPDTINLCPRSLVPKTRCCSPVSRVTSHASIVSSSCMEYP